MPRVCGFMCFIAESARLINSHIYIYTSTNYLSACPGPLVSLSTLEAEIARSIQVSLEFSRVWRLHAARG